MGGYGSGSWYRWSKKETTESQHRIDVRVLKKWGQLDGHWQFRSWSWTCNGKETGSVRYRVEPDSMVLNYRHRRRGGEWEPVEQRITFDRTPCHYGGYRVWFICPRCYRRVAVLYGAGKYFLCRHCHGLTYASQQEGFGDRMIRKARKIRRRLDKNNTMFDLFPFKPKGMHWKTYELLRNEAVRASLIGWKEWENRLAGCNTILNRVAEKIGRK